MGMMQSVQAIFIHKDADDALEKVLNSQFHFFLKTIIPNEL